MPSALPKSEIDAVAEYIAEHGCGPRRAATALGKDQNRTRHIWRLIVARYGWQAQ